MNTKNEYLNKIRHWVQPYLWKYYRWKFSKPYFYKYKNLKLKIYPSVFYPGFFATKMLIDYLDKIDPKNKSFLELGAGNGLVSLLAAQGGAKVTASDINPVAIKGLEENAENHNLQIICIESDLFDKIPPQEFDFIFINPPFFSREPKDMTEAAFFGGEDFLYFKGLFQQLKLFISSTTKIIMILTEECDLDKITQLALEHDLKMKELENQINIGEKHILYQIIKMG